MDNIGLQTEWRETTFNSCCSAAIGRKSGKFGGIQNCGRARDDRGATVCSLNFVMKGVFNHECGGGEEIGRMSEWTQDSLR